MESSRIDWTIPLQEFDAVPIFFDVPFRYRHAFSECAVIVPNCPYRFRIDLLEQIWNVDSDVKKQQDKSQSYLLRSIPKSGPKNRFATTPPVTGSDAVDIADIMPLVDGSSS